MIRAGCRFRRRAKAGCQPGRPARGIRPRNAAFGAPRPPCTDIDGDPPAGEIHCRASDAPEIDPFATGGLASPGLPWRPATEIDVDADNTPEIALADSPAPSGGNLAPPPRVRWRQRAVGRCRAAPGGALEAPHPQVALPHADNSGRPAATFAAGGSFADPVASHATARVEEGVSRDGLDASDTRHASHGSATDHAGESGKTSQPRHIGAAGSPRGSSDTREFGGPSGTLDIAAADGPARHADHLVEADPESASGPEADFEPDDAATAASIDPQRAPRDIELWLLARRAQGAALRLDFELRTALARQVFRRDFVYVSRQLHALEASRRVQGLDRARLNDALVTLRQRGDAIQAFMELRATELQAAIDAHGPASTRIAFARPARFQATIVSPGAHRFLTLLLQADETLTRLEMAWLLGLVEPASRSTLVSDCRRALLGFKDLACDLRRAVGRLVQEVNSQRRVGVSPAGG